MAVISDIHGNLEAFKEVLHDIDGARIDHVVCLGDNVGYGPEPEGVVTLVRQREIPCVLGNHEAGIIDPSYLGWFNSNARNSLLITRKLLSSETLNYLRGLKETMICHGSLCVHGVPPSSVFNYLFELQLYELKEIFLSLEQTICFVGHTHLLRLIGFDGDRVSSLPMEQGGLALEEGVKYIVNAGSVGQPRDGSNKAKYVIWDASRNTIEARFVPYDISVTARKILELNLPALNAARLW